MCKYSCTLTHARRHSICLIWRSGSMKETHHQMRCMDLISSDIFGELLWSHTLVGDGRGLSIYKTFFNFVSFNFQSWRPGQRTKASQGHASMREWWGSAPRITAMPIESMRWVFQPRPSYHCPCPPEANFSSFVFPLFECFYPSGKWRAFKPAKVLRLLIAMTSLQKKLMTSQIKFRAKFLKSGLLFNIDYWLRIG